MANFGGRRAPNVSLLISQLNAVPSENDIATRPEDDFNFADDLALWTNTDFFDNDVDNGIEEPSAQYDPSWEERTRRENAAARRLSSKGMDFTTGDYSFPEVSPLSPIDTVTNLDPTTFEQVYAPHPNGLPASFGSPAAPHPNTPTFFNSPTAPFDSIPYPGSKRPASSSSVDPASNFEEGSQIAAEEDKRRRNTAASARFRVKKKQREQELERKAKDLDDKANVLQSRIAQLETENAFLRSLVVEKNGEEDLEVKLDTFGKEGRKGDERSLEESKQGVGTAPGVEKRKIGT